MRAVNLTQDQAQVAAHRSGAGLVLAGAGSGKTSTVSVRTINLIEEGWRPERMLKMTFSRKAAGEMRHRMVEMAGPQLLKGMSVDTFHSFGFRLIREFADRFGRTSAVTVADESDQRRFIKDSAKSAGLDMKESKVKRSVEKVRSVYSYAKNAGLSMQRDREAIEELVRYGVGGIEKTYGQMMSMLDGYEQMLRRSNVVDFDDLCLLPGRALDQDAELARVIGQRYDHLTIDESQDTNLTQYWITRALARHSTSVLLIGDLRQCIYRFRGARIENVQSFITDFDPRQYLMRQNFRSTVTIVDAANALIANNRLDMGESFSSSEGGFGFTVIAAQEPNSGIRQIQAQLRKVLDAGVPLGEIAFLGRVKRLSRLAEVAISQLGHSLRIVGGTSIYESLEGRAAIAAARLLQNPYDGAAVAALGAFHPDITEGVIAQTLEGVSHGLDAFSALRSAGARGAQAAADLEERLGRLRETGPTGVGEWVSQAWGLDLAGFYELKKQRAKTSSSEDLDKECARRLENLALIDVATSGAIARLADERAGREVDPGEWSTWVPEKEQWDLIVQARLDDREEGKAPKKDVITVSTVHRSKGLEWSFVFVLGMSETILPMIGPDDEDDDDGGDDSIEEERRLAYVAVTRAKKGCALVHIESMGRFVARNSLLEPSRFIAEMGLCLPAPGLEQQEMRHQNAYAYGQPMRKKVATQAPW